MPVAWIEASAGTGKTYTLVQRVLALIVDDGLPVEQILLVTFTEKATAELKTRIRQGLRDRQREQPHERLAQALEDLPSMAITTIHGFCRMVLSQFPLESGLSFQPELVDQSQSWRTALRDEIRPQLEALDPQDLSWSGWEDENDLLQNASFALARHAFSRPLRRPDAEDLADYDRVRTALTAPRLDALLQAVAELRLPESVTQWLTSGEREALFKKNTLGKAYRTLRQWGERTSADRLEILDRETIQSFRHWDSDDLENKTHLWKKNHPEPGPQVRRLQEAAAGLAEYGESLRSSRNDDIEPSALLRGAARWRLLAPLAQAVLAKHSDTELTFHSMIDRVRALAASPAGAALIHGVRRRWSAVLVDEFQDTDTDQWTIFSSFFLTPSHSLVLVGDPKQSIYRFRGADLEVYRKAKETCLAHGAEVITLDENYRSTTAMIQAVNERFDQAAHPEVLLKDFLPVKKGAKPAASLKHLTETNGGDTLTALKVFRAEGELDWNRFLVSQVLELTGGSYVLSGGKEPDRPVHPGHILILVRAKRQAWALHRLLTAKGVPSIVGGSGGLLKTKEASEILLFLKALEDPRSLGKIRALSWTRLFLNADPEVLAGALDEAQKDRRRGAYVRAFRHVLAALEPQVVDGGGLEAVLRQPRGERIVTNAEHVLELLQDRVHRGEARADEAASALERWKESGADEDEIDLRQSTDSPTLRLMTIHAAKGLESPVVFHGFPSERKPSRPLWLVGETADFLVGTQAWNNEKDQQEHEAWRLRYVAETRAQAYQILPSKDSSAPQIPRWTPAEWDEVPSWQGPVSARHGTLTLLPSIADLPARRPAVESHSGLWKRALRQERGAKAEWDYPRTQRDEEAQRPVPPESELPAGAVFGDLIHNILEVTDWRDWHKDASREQKQRAAEVVEQACIRARVALGGRDWTKPVDTWLAAAVNTPFVVPGSESALLLSELPFQDTRRELEFHLPLTLPPGQIKTLAWDQHELSLRHGYLTGRIDVILKWEGRLFVLDWKTNRLGPDDDLASVMRESGYDLQAQWYWEALRKLTSLQKDPPPLGGVIYLFLRGPQGPPEALVLTPETLNRETRLRSTLEASHA